MLSETWGQFRNRENKLFLLYLVLNPFDVATAQALYFTTEFNIAADCAIIEDAEAVDDGNRSIGHSDHRIGVKLQVSLMADDQNYGISFFECVTEGLLNVNVSEFFLITEISRPGMAGCRVGILLFQFSPVRWSLTNNSLWAQTSSKCSVLGMVTNVDFLVMELLSDRPKQ